MNIIGSTGRSGAVGNDGPPGSAGPDGPPGKKCTRNRRSTSSSNCKYYRVIVTVTALPDYDLHTMVYSLS